MIALLVVLIVAGILGGTAAYLMRAPATSSDTPGVGAYLATGVVASFCVPIFLLITQSQIIKSFEGDVVKTDGAGQVALFLDLLYIAGIALIAAFSSRAFMSGIADKLLQDVKAADAKATTAASKAAEAEQKAAAASQQATDSQTSARSALSATSKLRDETASIAAKADTALAATSDLRDQASSLSAEADEIRDTVNEIAENIPEPDSAQAEPAPDSVLGADPYATTDVSDLDYRSRAVLSAIAGSRFGWRLASGIARDAQLPKPDVEDALGELAERGLVVTKSSAKTGAHLFQVSSRGKIALQQVG